ncbi:uncharacterized protein [Asterias amurensis]|uniref:uncharacterized protein isoform X1 n=2 Tax=Asterias amurensis TaxID=7602 RepID=UPI003AB5B160
MQHDSDHDGHIDMFSHSTTKYGEQKEHIDLKQFPSHPHYSAADHIDNNSFSASSSSNITQSTPDLSKSSHHRSLHRSLKMNNRILGRRRPFQCRYCSFTCPSATNLSIHMRIHTGEKPYKCGTCSYASARKQNLFRHITTVHKSDPVEASASLHSAYPIGLQPTLDDGLPIVENVYGNVQDVVFVDGESVKVIGRDQSQYPTSELSPTTPHISQVFSCDSQASSSSSQQPDVVDVTPVTNPTSATEFSTRHYADGSRFIFASGNAATTINTKISPSSVLDPQFNANSEIVPQHTQSGAMNNGAQQLQQASSQIAISTKKTEAPIQATVYKEAITGAMKRKQGKSSSHTTLKNILDSPMILQNKNTGNSTIASSSVGSFRPLETMNSSMKIIQSEEDLEDVLEGRQKSFRSPSSIASNKQQSEFPQSARKTGSVRDTGFLSFSRESPGDVYTPETSRKVRMPDTLPQQTHIATSQTRIFRRNQFPIMNSSPMRIAKEKSIKNPESAGSTLIKQTAKRPIITNVTNRKIMTPQSSENQRKVNFQNFYKGPTVKERNVSAAPVGQDLQDRKRSPVVHLENDQSFMQESSRQMSSRRYNRGSLTVQVDLSKLMCCAARKLLQAHLEECDVCEINLPFEKEERQVGCRGQPGCSPRFVEKHENDDIFGRQGNSSQDSQSQRYSNKQQAGANRTSNVEQVVTIDTDDEMDLSDLSNSRNFIHEPRSVQVRPGVGRLVLDQNVAKESSKYGPLSSHRRSCSPPTTEPSGVANTSLVGSRSIPITSPYVQPRAPQSTLEHSAEQLRSKRSAEILAYMNAELQQGMKRKQPRKCDLCGKVFHTKAQLRNHRRVHIETRQLFRCTICRYCTVHYKFLKRHIMEKHVGRKPNTTQGNFCKESTKTGEMASLMEVVHTDEGAGRKQDEAPSRDSSLSLDENNQPPEKQCKHQDMIPVDTDDSTTVGTDVVMSQETEGSTSQIPSEGDKENAIILAMEVKQEEITEV